GIRDLIVTGVQTCALPISTQGLAWRRGRGRPNSGAGEQRFLRKVRGEASGVVEVGFVAFGMSQRPVGFGPVALFEDRRQAELPRSEERRVGKECRSERRRV